MADEPITITGWPLVEIHFNGPASDAQVPAWLDTMDQLLARQSPFGLLTATGPDSDFAEAGRRAMGIWFRQNRQPLQQFCVGVARVAPNQQAIQRLAGPKMQAAMPCPIFASVERAEALAWLQAKLPGAQ